MVKGGSAPNEVKVDTGLVRLKPKLVNWTWASWSKLKQKGEMIAKGWEKCGLGSVLDAAQQMEAMRFCMNRPAEQLGDEVEQQDQSVSDSEGEDDDKKGDADVDGAIADYLTD